jgi:hypothetical protein
MLALLAGAAHIWPCDVTAETAAAGKGKIAVKLFVDCIHRRCPLAITDTRLETEGLVIEKQGEWKKVEGSVYELDMVVSLTGKSKGKIRVLRSCPKRGLQEEAITVAPL